MELDFERDSDTKWGEMLRNGQSSEVLPLDELDGKTIVLRGSFEMGHME